MEIYAVYVLIAVVILLSAGMERRIQRIDRKVTRMDQKLDVILGHLGLQAAGPDLHRVEALLREGRTISAIKAYREITGADLKSAKDEVERMAARQG
ncbi:hypothetical protein ABT112_07780 [Streptomyces sp. NPDC002055]|uniref:hypothetical protein n=1 Tax=Streptomyces sp. NPDC002055 TaxID=3154534 RepID=UPI00331E209C